MLSGWSLSFRGGGGGSELVLVSCELMLIIED